MGEVLSMERGIQVLRGEDAVAAWKVRLVERPMIPGTLHRAPLYDPRHRDHAFYPSLLGRRVIPSEEAAQP